MLNQFTSSHFTSPPWIWLKYAVNPGLEGCPACIYLKAGRIDRSMHRFNVQSKTVVLHDATVLLHNEVSKGECDANNLLFLCLCIFPTMYYPIWEQTVSQTTAVPSSQDSYQTIGCNIITISFFMQFQRHIKKSEGQKIPKVELQISIYGVKILDPKTKVFAPEEHHTSDRPSLL